jgi:hypothetical protein
MSGFRQWLATVLGLCFAQTLSAQPHYNTWFRGTLNTPISPKLDFSAEFQHRRQSGPDKLNPMNHNLMVSYRTWMHYQYSSQWRLSVSPFAYFQHYKVIRQSVDERAAPSHEVRFSATAELQKRLTDRLYFVGRTATELRIFRGTEQPDILRLRNRPSLWYNVAPRVKLGIHDELMFNVGGAAKGHFFDQNRIGIDFGYELSRNLKVNMGYLFIHRLPLTATAAFQEHNLFLNITANLRDNR